jgi:hypothetical protein
MGLIQFDSLSGKYLSHNLDPFATGEGMAFDPETNTLLVSYLHSGHAQKLRIDGGVVMFQDQPVPITADGTTGRATKLYAAVLEDFDDIADGTKVLTAADVIPTLRKLCVAVVVFERLLRQAK